MQNKQEIRKQILEIRNQIPEEERIQRSKQIADLLEALSEFKSAQHILFYYTNGSEVDTTPLIDKYLSSKQLYLPVIKNEEDFHAVAIQHPLHLENGTFGIPEPIGDPPDDESMLGLIIVPGVAFDKTGNRIGTGKGYYDRFLPRCPNAIKIGLAFDEQILDQVPKDPYDVAVDFIVTDNEVYKCLVK